MNLQSLGAGFVIGAILFSCLSIAIAWTGPTSAPPNGNVSAPINTGMTNQVKNGGLSVNALAVFGNTILSGASRYLNFGTTIGSGGYGIRDNAGVMQFRNSTGSWQNMVATSSVFQTIVFSDGTTQTTAATAASLAQTTRSCGITTAIMSGTFRIGNQCTTAACPSGYIRTGCSAGGDADPRSAAPSGSGACYCRSGASDTGGTCYTYCVSI
jgi:hypothetical protein